jgi:hypothetical protein
MRLHGPTAFEKQVEHSHRNAACPGIMFCGFVIRIAA